MPSPYGNKRGADVYYQHGGLPRKYVYNWQGVPFPQEPSIVRRAVAGIPDDIYIQDFEDELGDTLDVNADIDVAYHAESLGALEELGYGSPQHKNIEEHAAGAAGAAGSLGPGHPVTMSNQYGRRSVFSTFPDEMKMAYGEPASLGLFGHLSENEKRLFQIGAVAGAAYLIYQWSKKR